MSFLPPEPISADHVPTHFDCGRRQLNRWLIKHALANEITGRSRTFVVREHGEQRIAAYYCLSSAMVGFGEATSRTAAGMPADQPIPAILLGRLAVDVKHQSKGLGRGLLGDAVRRTFEDIGRNVGVRVLLVHAKDEDAARFYCRWGFEPSPTDELHLMLLAQDVQPPLGP